MSDPTAACEQPVPPRIWLILGAAAVGGIYYLMLVGLISNIAGAMAQHRFYRLTDFATMWNAGRLLRVHQTAILYREAWFDTWLQQQNGGARLLRNWIYPPPMGLCALAVSWMPLPLAFWLWRGGMLILSAGLLRYAGLGWLSVAAGLLGPAEFYDVSLGQNGALTGGLLAASLLMWETRKLLSACLAGCLAIKPQVGVLLPAVLCARKYHRQCAAALLTVAALALVSTWAEGWACWWLFIVDAQPVTRRIMAAPFGQNFQMTGFTVFLMARSFGAATGFASAIQALSTASAALAAWRVWRIHDADRVARMTVTVCLSVLAMPYGFDYDLVAFSIAMAALVPRADARWLAAIGILWLWPGFNIWLTQATGFVLLPFAALAGLVLALLQLRKPVVTAGPAVLYPAKAV